MDVTPENI